MLGKKRVWVPEVLKMTSKGTLVKVWTFLYLNQHEWFTAEETAKHLAIPLSTVQKALAKLRVLPQIICDDEPHWRGRPKKKYRYSEEVYDFK